MYWKSGKPTNLVLLKLPSCLHYIRTRIHRFHLSLFAKRVEYTTLWSEVCTLICRELWLNLGPKNIIFKCKRVFLRHENASGRLGSYEEALLNMMIVLATNRLPLFEDFNKMKKWQKHFNQLNKLNISDMLLKVYCINMTYTIVYYYMSVSISKIELCSKGIFIEFEVIRVCIVGTDRLHIFWRTI